MKKYIKLTPFIIVILFFALIKIISLNAPYRGCVSHSKLIENLYLNGIVLNKFEDKANHLNRTFVVFQNQVKIEVNIEGDTSGLYNFINVGDSIYKEKNSMKTIILRESIKKVFFIDFGCEKIKR